MTKRFRNRILTLFILVFPFALFLAFLVSNLTRPLPPVKKTDAAGPPGGQPVETTNPGLRAAPPSSENK